MSMRKAKRLRAREMIGDLNGVVSDIPPIVIPFRTAYQNAAAWPRIDDTAFTLGDRVALTLALGANARNVAQVYRVWRVKRFIRDIVAYTEYPTAILRKELIWGVMVLTGVGSLDAAKVINHFNSDQIANNILPSKKKRKKK